MKSFELGDPMEMVGVGLPDGDLDYMAECLIEEYMLMGWNERRLLALFTRPSFRMTHRICVEKGEDHVRALIQRVGDKWRRGRISGGMSDA